MESITSARVFLAGTITGFVFAGLIAFGFIPKSDTSKIQLSDRDWEAMSKNDGCMLYRGVSSHVTDPIKLCVDQKPYAVIETKNND